VTSTDGGASFGLAAVSGLPSGSSILSFAGAKQNGVTKLACVTASSADVSNGLEMGSISQSGVSGIWTLTLGQSSWTKATTAPAGDGPLIVSMALGDTSDIYVGGTNYSNGDPIIAKSTNGGTTFSDVLNLTNNGNVATGWQGAGGDRQWSFDQLTEGFEVSPANSNDLAFTGLGYLHLSIDGGATWRQAYVNPANQNPAGSNTPQHKAYQGIGLEDTSTLYLDWANQQTIVAGYTDIYGVRSVDGGQSWSFPTGISLAGNTVYCIVQQGSTLYAATSNTHDIYQSTHVTDASVNSGTGSIIYSTNSGATWQTLHSFGHPVIWVATDPNDPQRLYASVVSSTAGGIYTTDDLSDGVNAIWAETTAPPRTQGHPFNIDVLNDGTFVATFSGRRAGSSFADSSGVFTSSDHGQSWTDVTGAGMHWWTKDITIDPTDPTQSTWYASVRFAYGTTGASNTGGLYRTTNRGQTWTQIYQSIGAESAAINPITGEMYLATEENGLYYSSNPKAASPVFTQTTYPFRQPERIFFNPYNPNEIWITSFGYGLTVGTAASVSGSIFNDANNNAIRDAGETGLAGWTVLLTPTGTTTGAQQTTTTAADGTYSFYGILPGAYSITQTLQTGYALTAPIGGSAAVTITAGPAASGAVFGDVLISSVTLNFNMLVALSQDYNQPGTFANGDLNGDGIVNFNDLVLLSQNYNQTLPIADYALATVKQIKCAPAKASRIVSVASTSVIRSHPQFL
ncbi:MAG TPA: SdrD B-like domain-containing protein, partial [Humisphaera sp.]|nr:SdrD B-like domain-containing protein [Humisphaera sp.]